MDGTISSLSIRHYFVDEAGDATVFDRKGQAILGQEGCSQFFILGLLDVAEPAVLAKDLTQLRETLLTDPYFKKVPSMQISAKKTAVAFHAKDDIPEVRREVFSLLIQHQLRFFAVVRNKYALLDYIRQRNERDPAYRYAPNELYDYLTRRLFKDRLHQDDGYNICFAKRGQSNRTAALKHALESAKARFQQQWGIINDVPLQTCQVLRLNVQVFKLLIIFFGHYSGSTNEKKIGTSSLYGQPFAWYMIWMMAEQIAMGFTTLKRTPWPLLKCQGYRIARPQPSNHTA